MTTKTKLTHAEVIDAIGIDLLVKHLETDRSHVRTMRSRDRIPDGYWNKVVRAARAKGLENIGLKTLSDAAELKLSQ